MKNKWKKAASFALTFMLFAGAATQNIGGFLTGNSTVAFADESFDLIVEKVEKIEDFPRDFPSVTEEQVASWIEANKDTFEEEYGVPASSVYVLWDYDHVYSYKCSVFYGATFDEIMPISMMDEVLEERFADGSAVIFYVAGASSSEEISTPVKKEYEYTRINAFSEIPDIFEISKKETAIWMEENIESLADEFGEAPDKIYVVQDTVLEPMDDRLRNVLIYLYYDTDSKRIRTGREAYPDYQSSTYICLSKKIDTAVREVMMFIEFIPDNAALADKEDVEFARHAYNKLTDAQKEQIDSKYIARLEAAEAAIAAAEKKAVAEVTEAIETLPDDIAVSSEADVNAAREACDALTDAQQEIVAKENYDILLTAETENNKLETVLPQTGMSGVS